jgi:small subunit ribosomal protein S14
MAKKSSIENNKRRAKLAKAYAGRRERLKAKANDEALTAEERFEARLKLAELPRNSAAIRIRKIKKKKK